MSAVDEAHALAASGEFSQEQAYRLLLARFTYRLAARGWTPEQARHLIFYRLQVIQGRLAS